MKQLNAKILQNTEIANGFFDLIVHAPEIAKITKPGQFANLICGEKQLRRPISICDAEAEGLRMVYEIRGEGTKILSALCPGQMLDLLAPLGNGFHVENAENILFIGGGIGIPPLLYAAKSAKSAEAILGFRTKSASILIRDFEKACEKVSVTSDDGSIGHHGFVTDVLEKRIKTEKFDLICACGPTPMLRAVSKLAKAEGIPCQISLEERMACGIGACLVCACALKTENQYGHVCKDGPVFDSRSVAWDD